MSVPSSLGCDTRHYNNNVYLRMLMRSGIDTSEVMPQARIELGALCEAGLAKTVSVGGYVYYVITEEGKSALAQQ